MDAHRLADVSDAAPSHFQKFFCFFHPLLQEILFKGHLERIFEYPSKIDRIQVNMGRN